MENKEKLSVHQKSFIVQYHDDKNTSNLKNDIFLNKNGYNSSCYLLVEVLHKILRVIRLRSCYL